MTDLSAELEALLRKHNSRLQHHRRSIEHITDEFLKDAYQIQSHIGSLHAYLRSIRGPYLTLSQPGRKQRGGGSGGSSSAGSGPMTHLSNAQRDSIDAESKATLRDLDAAVGRLSSTERQRRDIRRQIQLKRAQKRFPLGALGRWAAGSDAAVDAAAAMTPKEEEEEARERTKDAWREGVLWYLQMRLGRAMDAQRDMMEKRVMREVERSKSVLYKTKGGGGAGRPSGMDGSGPGDLSPVVEAVINGSGDAKRAALADDRQGTGMSGGGTSDSGLTSAQLQEFAEENNAMLRHYEDTLDQVREAERSMIEISELQTTLASNLEMQSTRIDQLVEDAANTQENVTGGNKQLKQATERFRPAKWFFYVSCGLSGFLIFWDLVV